MRAASNDGRFVEARAALEALEDSLRAAAVVARSAFVVGNDEADASAWHFYEQAADGVMAAAAQLSVAKSFMAGARLRGGEV